MLAKLKELLGHVVHAHTTPDRQAHADAIEAHVKTHLGFEERFKSVIRLSVKPLASTLFGVVEKVAEREGDKLIDQAEQGAEHAIDSNLEKASGEIQAKLRDLLDHGSPEVKSADTGNHE